MIAEKLTIIGPVVCGLIYTATAVAFATDRRPSWSLVYLAYAVANAGLVWASIVEKQ